ncbi:unnamed protein product [Nesidiocoris tenuis]|uniref:Neurotransmitter-gated ion-channel ligand-binding domain-containing protein n=1 Tax=Nesidiocoris tenuis TaxID=355587 RepID=A0A6H5HSB9_9HEMI|nr:unnamed protein product [Nesidiocoris tenuis]
MDFVLYPLDVQKCAVDFSSLDPHGLFNCRANQERLRGMFQHPKVSPQESHANTNNATMISTNLANATANAANTANSVANSHSHPVANSKDPSPVQNDIAAHATSAAKEPVSDEVHAQVIEQLIIGAIQYFFAVLE